ncbi:outer membrane protein assembly factor BamE [Croceibacterium aestuarii]|uniref:outer membrane protein assembly factor BamE n=1 Tax=Croceibacterium aestuarii TaxID=3064139 RepID=UPI00272E3098|nr:outer membrane protein assembly factor BamE [Croceibacterium sp. D39]
MTVKLCTALLLGTLALTAGCSTINEHRGYIIDETLVQAVQPGIDNRQSVEATLGRPTFTSMFGTPTWYYVSNLSAQKPFTDPKIRQHTVLAVTFDEAGNVTAADRSGMDAIVRIDPEGDKTPTLGRERNFLQDLFGNIGQVGAGPGAAGGGQGQ